MRGFRNLAGLAFALALAQGPEFAQAASKAAPHKPAKTEPAVRAAPLSPAMFRVVNGKSTVTILGSIHVLPAGLDWQTPAIELAIRSADGFIFEADLDYSTSEFDYFLDKNGYLPRGQTLHKMLSPPALKSYVALIRASHIDPARLDYLRPGVAVFLLETGVIRTRSAVPLGPGVDATLVAYAKGHSKPLGYLETLQSQFELLTTVGGGSDIAVLEKMLIGETKNSNGYQATLAAWMQGDLPKLASLEAEESDPKEQALVLDDRNRAWLPGIEEMLTNERSTLITVGALHLAGPNGVIGLLCARHWKVQRVQTGPTPPPAACPG